MLLLVPSAKVIPAELQAEFGPLASTMVPLNNKPALAYILESYADVDFTALIAVDECQESVHTFLATRAVENVKACAVSSPQNLGDTVLQALRATPKPFGHLIINFGDTLVRRSPTFEDVIVYAKKRESFRWTTFNITDGYITELTEKQYEKDYLAENNVFVGVFEIAHPQRFEDLLAQAVETPSPEIDPFYLALQQYVAVRRPDVRYEESTQWHDFGHLDTYYTTRRALSSGAREFNTVSVDTQRGSIQKRSRHTTKFRNEISWYLNLPKNLKRFTPRLYDYSLDPHAPFVEMEYYGYPPLNDVYLHGAYDIGEWELILGAINFYLEEAHAYRYTPQQPDELPRALREMYERKTLERITPVLEDRRFEAFWDELSVNGRRVMGLRQVITSLPRTLERGALYQLPYFTVLHGDLCLSNILFDRHNATIRVIDPRGDFGGYDIYGDFRYDLAKLSHSIHGDYDFYVNGMFDLEHTPEHGLFLRPYLLPRHHATKQLFERWLTARFPACLQQVRLIESLLFLSMVPLHADHFQSQQAFLGRGLELYTASLEDFRKARTQHD